MTDYKFFLGIAGTLAAFLQYGLYIKDILQGKTRPHAFSWFVWGLPCSLLFYGLSSKIRWVPSS